MGYQISKYDVDKLGRYAEIFPGFAFKSERFTDDPSDVALVKGENVQQGFVDWIASKYWPAGDVDSFKKFELRVGDVVLAMDRPWVTAGLKWAYIKGNDPRSLLVQRVSRLRAKNGLNQTYLRCLISSGYFSDYIQPIVTGVNVPHVSGKQIGDFKIPLPPPHIQQKIAAILSAYDELIDNNKRRIALLEKMAEEIYREWFVRLRFPGHEKVKVIKGVPEGWAVKKLGELTRTQYGYTASAEIEGQGPQFLRITDIVPAAIDWEHVPHCKIDEKDEEKYLLHEGDIVVARTGATVGYAKRINKRHPKAVFASYLVRLIPKRKNDAVFLGLSVERSAFRDFIWMFVTGAAQPQANATTMALFPILYPPESLLNEFNRIAEPILDEKELLLNQVTALSRTRDMLLPRLISGKLSVENLDIQFPPSMAEEAEPVT